MVITSVCCSSTVDLDLVLVQWSLPSGGSPRGAAGIDPVW